MFKTETHLHTSEISKCGKVRAADMIKLYHEKGYKTVFVTDHFSKSFAEALGDMSWEDKITVFMSGYYRAKEAGKQFGMNVLFAAEVSFSGAANDYLVYGLTREFLNEHPDMYETGIEKFSEIAKENNLFIVQAHPLRDNVCSPMPEFVDAMEVYNSNPRHQDFSEIAEQCADENNLYKTSGSDSHRLEDIGKAGVISETEIKSTEDYINIMKTGGLKIFKG